MRAFLLVPLLLLFAPAARAADHFTDGGWSGGEYDANGRFQRCSMTGEFMPGEFVTFRMLPTAAWR